jgi:hypothetical protein
MNGEDPLRVHFGRKTRVRRTPYGPLVNFDGDDQEFIGSWSVELIGTSQVSIGYGEINGKPGTIDGVPLDGTKDDPTPPVLSIPNLRVDDDGRGYICAEVRFDPKAAWGIVEVEMVQVAGIDTDKGDAPKPGAINYLGGAAPLSGNRARVALAMLRLRSSGTIDVHQIEYFDLQCRTAFGADGKPSRHFFS